jgi:hypothetical protein
MLHEFLPFLLGEAVFFFNLTQIPRAHQSTFTVLVETGVLLVYPLVNVYRRLHNYGKSAFLNIFHGKTHYTLWQFNVAIENDHRNSGFSD